MERVKPDFPRTEEQMSVTGRKGKEGKVGHSGGMFHLGGNPELHRNILLMVEASGMQSPESSPGQVGLVQEKKVNKIISA